LLLENGVPDITPADRLKIVALSRTFPPAVALTLIDEYVGGAVKIPKELEIPALVFGLQGVMLLGWILMFLIL